MGAAEQQMTANEDCFVRQCGSTLWWKRLSKYLASLRWVRILPAGIKFIREIRQAERRSVFEIPQLTIKPRTIACNCKYKPTVGYNRDVLHLVYSNSIWLFRILAKEGNYNEGLKVHEIWAFAWRSKKTCTYRSWNRTAASAIARE